MLTNYSKILKEKECMILQVMKIRMRNNREDKGSEVEVSESIFKIWWGKVLAVLEEVILEVKESSNNKEEEQRTLSVMEEEMECVFNFER
jgi:hypothetical protein